MATCEILQKRRDLILYHGSTDRVVVPELRELEGQKDFGAGFYLAVDRDQAAEFASLRMQRRKAKEGYVNQYYLESFDGLVVKEFETADAEWLQFIRDNRKDDFFYSEDVVIGKIADDDTRTVINDYISGRLKRLADVQGTTDTALAISMLKPEKLGWQILFHTQRAIERLKFKKATVIRGYFKRVSY